MELNVINLNSNAIFSSLGYLSANKTKLNSEENLFSILPEKNSIEDFFKENGLNLDNKQSPIKILLLLLNLILGLDSNKENQKLEPTTSDHSTYSTEKSSSSRANNSVRAATSTKKTSSTSTKTKTEEKTSEEISTDKKAEGKREDFLKGEKWVYDTVASSKNLSKFAKENPALFSDNATAEGYDKAFDKLTVRKYASKHSFHTVPSGENAGATIEHKVYDKGNGIYLHESITTDADGKSTRHRAVEIGVKSPVKAGEVSMTNVTNACSGDGDEAMRDTPKSRLNSVIEDLKREEKTQY